MNGPTSWCTSRRTPSSRARRTLPGPVEIGAGVTAEVTTALTALPAERPVPLHGDAHHGHAVLVDGVVTWWGLEDAWRGAVEWDVAVTAGALGDEADVAVDADGAAAEVVLDAGLLRPCTRLREVQGRA